MLVRIHNILHIYIVGLFFFAFLFIIIVIYLYFLYFTCGCEKKETSSYNFCLQLLLLLLLPLIRNTRVKSPSFCSPLYSIDYSVCKWRSKTSVNSIRIIWCMIKKKRKERRVSMNLFMSRISYYYCCWIFAVCFITSGLCTFCTYYSA